MILWQPQNLHNVVITIINFEFVLATLPYPKVLSFLVQVVTEELPISFIQKLALHQNWVEFRECYIDFIRTSLSMS